MGSIQLSLFGRMSQGQSLATMAKTLKLLSGKWQTQGLITSNGECWTVNGSESHSEEEESLCLLSGILQPSTQVGSKYFLSAKAAKGILNRAEQRGKEVPVKLLEALQEVAGLPKQPIVIEKHNIKPESEVFSFYASQGKQDQFTANISTTLKASSITCMADSTVIRRLTEIECERLMGWNDDHTRYRADGTETPMTQRYKMCGNGVVSPVATWIAQRITPVLRSAAPDANDD